MKNEITIVGAGIIGMSLALVFSSKNKKVTILERNLKKVYRQIEYIRYPRNRKVYLKK